MEIIQNEEKSSGNRRRTVFAKGKAEGIKEAESKAAAEIAALQAANATLQQTNADLHTRLVNLCEQSCGAATGQLLATQAAADFVVETQHLKNKVASLEKVAGQSQLTIADQAADLESLRQTNRDQAAELESLRQTNRDQARHLAAFLGVPASDQRPRGSAYLNNSRANT